MKVADMTDGQISKAFALVMALSGDMRPNLSIAIPLRQQIPSQIERG